MIAFEELSKSKNQLPCQNKSYIISIVSRYKIQPLINRINLEINSPAFAGAARMLLHKTRMFTMVKLNPDLKQT